MFSSRSEDRPHLSAAPVLPDEALAQLLTRREEQFAALLREDPDLARVLDASGLAEELPQLWSASDFAAELCCQTPLLLRDLLEQQELDREGDADWDGRLQAFLARWLAAPPSDPQEALRRGLRAFRNRELLRLLWRELTGRAAVMETCRALSCLADACIRYALDVLAAILQPRYGRPLDAAGREQELIVLAMGKYGAYELNFSSDIDLIFAFPEDGETTVTAEWQVAHPHCHPVTLQHYFSRLGQLLLNAFDAMTSDGFVFRVDLRLRPYGNEGAVALSLDALEEYYQTQGRDWERFAMIKVRAVTGAEQSVTQLLAILRAFSYRRYLDFATVAALRELKHQIEQQVRRKGMQANIKLGSGGIREIEFIVQVLQLIYGGRLRQLQVASILTAFDELVRANCMDREDAEVLRAAYLFLRRLENAVQALEDKQTHDYPQDALAELRVARALGYDTAASLRAEFDCVRDAVAGHFADVIADPRPASGAREQGERAMIDVWQGALDCDKALGILADSGYARPEEVLQTLDTYRKSRQFLMLERRGRERIDHFMPLLLSRLAQEPEPDLGFARAFLFVQAVAQRTAYLVLLLENPIALSQLITLCSASPWVADLLCRYPMLLDELLRPLSQPPDKPQLQDLLRQELLRTSPTELDEQLASLQGFKQEQTLTVAAAELAGTMPLMKVSDYLTWLAEVVLAHVLGLAWEQQCVKYGLPCNSDGDHGAQDFVIIGYGKLGGIELNYGSDLDLVFMHDGHPDLDTTGGSAGTLNSSAFYVQLGQKVLSLLGTQTLTGKLYDIDMRLRPSGASGTLVGSCAAFLQYQIRDAWTWEHQALVRARAVAGSAALAQRFQQIRAQVLGGAREPAQLAQDIVSMRQRMRTELGSRQGDDTFHLKQDAGGLVDIEFIVQYLVLGFAQRHANLLIWTDNMRLLDTAVACGVLPAEEGKALQDIYIEYRMLLHRLALDKATYLRPGDEFLQARARVSAIWERLFAGVEPQPLADTRALSPS